MEDWWMVETAKQKNCQWRDWWGAAGALPGVALLFYPLYFQHTLLSIFMFAVGCFLHTLLSMLLFAVCFIHYWAHCCLVAFGHWALLQPYVILYWCTDVHFRKLQCLQMYHCLHKWIKHLMGIIKDGSVEIKIKRVLNYTWRFHKNPEKYWWVVFHNNLETLSWGDFPW